MLPLVVDLRDRRVLVVGIGRGSSQRVDRLRAEGALVTLVARGASAAPHAGVVIEDREFEERDLDGVCLVVAATDSRRQNEQIAHAAGLRGILVNAVDDPPSCSCYFTAEHCDGDVVIAVSTSGASPSLAQWLRDRVATSLPRGLGDVATELRGRRRALLEAGKSTEGLDWSTTIEELVGLHEAG